HWGLQLALIAAFALVYGIPTYLIGPVVGVPGWAAMATGGLGGAILGWYMGTYAWTRSSGVLVGGLGDGIALGFVLGVRDGLAAGVIVGIISAIIFFIVYASFTPVLHPLLGHDRSIVSLEKPRFSARRINLGGSLLWSIALTA